MNGLPGSHGTKLADAVPALSQALLREAPGRKLADAVPSLSQSLLGEVPLWICQSCCKSVEEEERRSTQEQPTPVNKTGLIWLISLGHVAISVYYFVIKTVLLFFTCDNQIQGVGTKHNTPLITSFESDKISITLYKDIQSQKMLKHFVLTLSAVSLCFV